ncbi:unnamed protein product [Bursaphelenchus okinawaensis]|uniref:protein-tyrosine-phosphatase n=1 Tax=Bursaphelenchus okinawaensis TaxID=465554 RepID=A0A811KYI7_9BILA|nr:unnamed protein product [Bursaphelenchus okinawaensis]CAG9113805.1 unnamed protein product [Bursaphelenchus okinawaensis]
MSGFGTGYAIAFIEKARSENKSVLVHCMAGISRSVTVCLAYLMYVMQCSLDDAFDRLLHQNASIQPNFHFMESLLCWEREIRKEIHEFVDENSALPSTNSSTASSTCSSA